MSCVNHPFSLQLSSNILRRSIAEFDPFETEKATGKNHKGEINYGMNRVFNYSLKVSNWVNIVGNSTYRN